MCCQHIENDIASLDNKAFTIKIRKRFRWLAAIPADNTDVVRHQVGRRKLEDAVPFGRVEHALDGIYLATHQTVDYICPWPQTDLYSHIHLFGNGTRQFDRKPGGSPFFVQIFEGWVVVVTPDNDRSVGGELQGGKPFRVETAVSAIRHYQGESFIEQRQSLPVPLPDGKTEVLAKAFDRGVNNLQVGNTRFAE